VARATVPLVLDADGLNAFAGDADALVGRDGRDLVITPHPGEMARLIGVTVDHVQTHRVEVAREFAATRGLYVVLKGARSVVATPEGAVLINMTGNPGMATGGTGDVLTGVVAAWLAQVLDAQAACALGVCLHGLAGDLAAVEHGEVGLIASDVTDYLGPAVLNLMAEDQDE
jgi:NAD(P)H-hydrate epimerase